jgi:Lsr2
VSAYSLPAGRTSAPMRGEPLRLTIDSTDDRDAAIAALGALFGVHLAVVGDAAIGDAAGAATESAPADAAAPAAPRRRGAKSRSARTASTATRGGRRPSARKAAPSPSVRTARSAARDTAVSSKELNGQIRSWAGRQGMAVAARGRIPASVVQAYRAANPA